MKTLRKKERQDHKVSGPAVAYFRHDTLGLLMEKNGQVYIYAPKKGLFQLAASAYITDDASALSFESAKQLWENYNRHYACLREADAPAPQPLQRCLETPRAGLGLPKAKAA